MDTNGMFGMFQSSEEERLKMLNCCCMPSDNLMPPNNNFMSSTADIFISITLIKRIEQLEEELTKNGIDIPEWKDLLKNGG